MAAQPPDLDQPRVGRPSLAVSRRGQVLSAFIELIAERGLEAVTLDDVAAAAGVQRSVIRHYVGNRTDLVRAAIELLTERYEEMIRARIGHSPTLSRLIDHLFSASWVSGMGTEDRALDVFLQEAARDDATRDRVKAMYQLLLDEIAKAIRSEHPTATAKSAGQAAYQIVCLAEHNVTMQHLGFPKASSTAARRLARRIANDTG